MDSEMRTALNGCRNVFLATWLFSFFINLLMLTAPIYMLSVYDRVLSSGSIPTLVMITLLAGGLLLTMAALDVVRSRLLVGAGARLDADLNQRVFSAVIGKNLKAPDGEHGQAIRDLDTLRQYLSGPTPFAFFDAPWVPIYLVLVFLFHPALGLVALAGAAVLFALAVLNEMLTRRPLRQAGFYSIAGDSYAEASLRNAEVLRAMGMVDSIHRHWLEFRSKSLGLQALASDRAGILTAASKAIRMFLQIAILAVGATLAIEQAITPGVMIAASIIMSRAMAPVEQAIGGWRETVGVRASYLRLTKLLAAVAPIQERTRLPTPQGKLTVERLVAAPPGADKPVLKSISFSLEPGSALAVIGPSAAGKSTLARLLVGVWSPVSGSVRLDAAEIGNWNAEDLGPHIGYLPQDVELFDGTVKDNIARFDSNADDEQVVLAAQRAGVHDMILRLPEDYQTPIGEGGWALSGGQRQRIALARALYGDPAMVVLDEPNANVDADGDLALTDAIIDLKQRGKTVIVIAHRQAAIAGVDYLMVLKDGVVQSYGPKEEVIAKISQVATAPQKPNVAHPNQNHHA